MNIITSFERKEIKYRMSYEKYIDFRRAADKYIAQDSYGLTPILNIYFDTDSFGLIRYSVEKPPYKEKLRLRSYGTPCMDSVVFLEIKKKFKGIVYKRRIALSYAEALEYIETKTPPKNQGQIFNEIDFFMKRSDIKPKVFLAYDRIAMYGRFDKDFRITFDFNIRSRSDNLRLDAGSDGNALDCGVITEIKTIGAIPIEIAHILSSLEIYPTSFSKYGQVYEKSCISKSLESDLA